jgi:hypothetical protein
MSEVIVEVFRSAWITLYWPLNILLIRLTITGPWRNVFKMAFNEVKNQWWFTRYQWQRQKQ